MKNFFLLFIVSILISCNSKDSNKITIDLNNDYDHIKYSSFIDSLSYITLNTNDSCLISGIINVYKDGDTLLIRDDKRGGIFIFTINGEFIKQINYYGQGPHEFSRIGAFAIDTIFNHICIYDSGSQKINKYDYKGNFIKSTLIDYIFRDFAVMDDNYLFIMPTHMGDYQPSGIWLSDSYNNVIKTLKNDVPEKDRFAFIFINYNYSINGIYYYDRNRDDYSFITKDSSSILYEFYLKQRVPSSVRKRSDPQPEKLVGHAMMAAFSNSNKYIALTYYTFGIDNPFKWVLINKEEETVQVSSKLLNDIDDIQSSQNYLYYINDNVWCRMLDTEENNCDITLQFLYLKGDKFNFSLEK